MALHITRREGSQRSRDAPKAKLICARRAGAPEVAVLFDCIAFEAKAHGADGMPVDAPAVVLNCQMEVTAAISVPVRWLRKINRPDAGAQI
jgi:hypothetical protein